MSSRRSAIMPSPKCLLIIPLSFYSFGNTIKVCLERRGYSVQLINDEFPANIIGKILGKIGFISLLRRLTLKDYKKRFPNSERTQFDLVLIFKGRGVSPELIKFLRTFSNRIIGYNFDSFGFNPSPLKWLQSVDRYCTFDIKDAADHHLPLVSLFSALPDMVSLENKKYDISVLMKNHSQRIDYVDEVLSSLPNTSRYVYIFEPNLFSFVWGALRRPNLYLKYWPYIHFNALPYDDFLKTLGLSKVTIDYAHPSQTGITIRCFEARSLGVSIITNNSNVLSTAPFDANSVAVFALGGDRELLENTFNRILKRKSTRSIRSVDDFMSELLDQNALNP